MHRRAVSIAALVALLVVTPAVAHAYSAPEYLGSVSTTAPVPGVPFTATIEGPADASVILTVTSLDLGVPDSAIDVAGTKSRAKTLDAGGEAIFTIVLSEGGIYTIVATDAASDTVIFSQAVQAGENGPVGTGTGAGAAGGGGLAVTGSAAVPLALGALALLAAGGVGLAVRRRRVGERVPERSTT